jgi:5-formyltetrahydrofolate cyclo-ligase
MDKRRLRAMMLVGESPDPLRVSQVVEGLFAWISARLPGTASAYLAMGGEVDVEPLLTRLPGWRWVLPRVEPDRSLTFRDRDLPRETHEWGMSQPVGAGVVVPVHEIDVVLVPGIAFDATGARLGRGGGYYDRLLAERRSDSVAVGVTLADRVLDVVPTDGHDQRVDFLATEDGVTACPPRS